MSIFYVYSIYLKKSKIVNNEKLAQFFIYNY